MSTKKISVRINEEITSTQARIIDEDGSMLGLMSPSKAFDMARNRGLDLIEISPNANPPVCKIGDFGKFKYEMQKKAHEAKKKQKVVEIKEIKVRPNIATGDYEVKLKNAIKFLKEKNKVKISLQFRGREITHKELGFEVVTKFIEDLSDYGKVEQKPAMEGRQIFAIVVPLA